MHIEDVEKIVEEFVKKKRNAETITVDSVKKISFNIWQVKGDYSLAGSDRIEGTFVIDVNENVKEVIDVNENIKEVVGYEFEDLVGEV